jgi:Ca2+-binding EF-hand superfamily protein
LCDAVLKSVEAVVLVVSVLSEELVSIEELKDAIKRIQKVPDDSLVNRISEVLAKIDIDKDGAIRLDEVLKVSIHNKFQKTCV